MEPTTTAAVLGLLTVLGRWAITEYRWFKSSERAQRKEAKQRRKLGDAAKSGPFKTQPTRGKK